MTNSPNLGKPPTIPPLGEVPAEMPAWVIRKERFGEPLQSFQLESMKTPEPGPGEALVLVMAAGVNYNGIWAGLGKPVSVLDVTKKDFHIAGSDASGIVWKVGAGVTRYKVGDEVILHCNVTCGQCPACNGFDPMACEDQKMAACSPSNRRRGNSCGRGRSRSTIPTST